MPSWSEITETTPDLAARVQRALEAHKHKIMATLRADGSPRISGTEVDISGGELWLGSMPDAMKARDLQRDPRFAIHSAPVDTELAEIPDAKIAGRAVEITDEAGKAAWTSRYRDEGHEQPPEPFHLFRLDIDELVCTSVAGDTMIIDAWHPATGTTQTTR